MSLPKVRVQVARREHVSSRYRVVLFALSLCVALLVSGLLVLPLGLSPLDFYRCFLVGSIASLPSLRGTLSYLIPIVLCGLSAIVSFRAGLWNIGQDGQFVVGAIAALGVSVFLLPPLPPPLGQAAALAVGALAGAVWGLIPGLLRAYTEANEAVTTLMMMYIAQVLLQYLCYGPWRSPEYRGFPYTYSVPQSCQLGIAEALIIMIAVNAIVYIIVERTKFRITLGVLTEGPKVAVYAGVPVRRSICVTMMLSGMLAGVAGALYLLYKMHFLGPTYMYEFGFAGIIAAWLCELKPLFIAPASFLLAMVYSSYDLMQITLHLSASTVQAVEGIVLMSILLVHFLARYRIRIVMVR